MAYKRFRATVPLATLATTATVQVKTCPSVADVASVAGHTFENGAAYAVQIDPNRCFICNGTASSTAPMVAVCTPIPGRKHWLHRDCHAEHVRRIEALLSAPIAGAA